MFFFAFMMLSHTMHRKVRLSGSSPVVYLFKSISGNIFKKFPWPYCVVAGAAWIIYMVIAKQDIIKFFFPTTAGSRAEY